MTENIAKRAWPKAGLAAVAFVFMVVDGHANLAAASDTKVTIANFTFDPPTLSVPVGSTVTWTNEDDIPHVVAEKDGAFRSRALDTGDAYTQKFMTVGTVEYYCAIHPHMIAKIVVTP
jgi:plastocyanin